MRSAIFIDGGYFLNQLKIAKVTPDYQRLPDFLLQAARKTIPIDLMRCYFYYCAPWMPQNPSEEAVRRMETHKAFVDQIESLDRWQVRLGKLERRWDGQKEYFEQKRVDVLLSIDLVRHATAGHIQHAILIAGDSDFIPAVTAAKEAGVVVTLWCVDGTTVHRDLIALVDEVHYFNWNSFPMVVRPQPAPVTERPRIQEPPRPLARPAPAVSPKAAPVAPRVTPAVARPNPQPSAPKADRRPRRPRSSPQKSGNK